MNVNLFSISAKDLMSKEVYSAEEDKKVSKAIGLMKNQDISSLPVLKEGKFEGMLTYRSIVERGISADSEVKTAIISTLKASPEESIIDLAYKLYINGLKSIPVCEGDILVGVITRYDIIQKIIEVDKYKKQPATDLMSSPVVGITENESIAKARKMMLDNKIRRLVVFDNKGIPLGIITLTDIAKKIYTLKKDAPTRGEVVGEKVKTKSLPVKGIMNRRFIYATPEDSISEISKLMIEEDISGVPIVEESNMKREKVVGMITRSDIIKEISKLKSKEPLPISIQGISGEPPFDVALVRRMVKDKVNKLSRLIRNLHYMKIYIKKYEKEGIRTKYSCSTHFKYEDGLIIAKNSDWRLSETVDICLDKLEEQLIQKKEKSIAERDFKGFKEKLRRLRLSGYSEEEYFNM